MGRSIKESHPGRHLLSCHSVALTLVLVSTASISSAEDWSLDKEADDIAVYTRPVEGSGIKEFKGVADVAAEIGAIVALLRDSDRFMTWFPNTSESKLLARDGGVSYQYSVMRLPWPLDDRDNVFRAVSTRDAATGVIQISISAAPDYHPIQEGRVRVQHAQGTWTLTPLASHETNVSFTMHLDPGGEIPQWMINAQIVATPYEALTNLRAAVKK